ncbi:MAG: 2-oxoacid:ferredoxin oxidoreductase subunit beta [Nitrospirota bacterium]
MPVHDYLRQRFFPQIWCSGCGHGQIMGSLLRSIEELGLHKNNVVLVSGIGCSSRMPGYLDFHTLHTIHGRALAFATGVKLGNPDLHVIVPMGDGDAAAIGGNHLIHAARRNINITAIVMNNTIYGMTGGQGSPTTPQGAKSATTPKGNIDPPFDLVHLVKGAGASYVARTTTYHAKEMQQYISKGIQHKGFSFIEILTQCPTYFGRKNKGGSPTDMMKQFTEITTPLGSDKKKENPALIERGIFVQEERQEYAARYAEMIHAAAGEK